MAQEKNKQVSQITDMEADFAQWFTDVCRKAELIDYSSIKGMFILRPYGYAIWENFQKILDEKFKETGHENVYLPMLIPESLLQKEKDHVEGFAPECAWVTYGGSEKLEERYCIRPTSETRRQREAGGALLHPPHLRDPVLRALRPHHPLPPGPAQAVQPVVLRPAVGEDLPPLPAPPGVPVAGGPHHARHRRGGHCGNPADVQHLRRLLRELPGHAGGEGPQDRQGACRW